MKDYQGTSLHNELKINGNSIHYYCTGIKGNELLILLHPAFADHRCFDKQVEFFKSEYRVITLDMPGHGHSAGVKVQVDKTVDFIDSLLALEGYSKAHIVGVSMGSLIAQFYGLKHPEKVLSMTILGGYNINEDNSEIMKAQRSEQVKWIFKALFSMNSFRRYVAKVSVRKPEEQQQFYLMAKMFTRRSFMAMQGLSNVLQKRDNIRLPYPLMILCGEHDIDLAKRASVDWHRSEPGSIFSLIPNAGHCANMDESEKFNELLANFIENISPGDLHEDAF